MENYKNKLRIVIEEYWRKELPLMKEREIELKLGTEFINDIMGPRRAGKTYLMFLAIDNLLKTGVDKKATIYVNFENRKLLPVSAELFNALVEIIYEEELLKKHKKIYLFLDEIQRVKEWEKYLRSIYDEFKNKIKIFISGSTSKLTKSELGHLLTGRHLTTHVFPLSFREFLTFRNFEAGKVFTEEDVAKIKTFLKEYLRFGGFPEVVINENKGEVLETLFSDIVHRDISSKIRKEKAVLDEIVNFLCDYSGKLVSFTKLSKFMRSRGVKISVPSMEKYFWHMKDAFLFFDLKIFSYKVKDQLQHPRKIYPIDPGVVNFSGFSENIGRVMENAVFLELLRKKSKNPALELYYWKDYSGKEVDFVVKDRLKVKQIIQVCYSIVDPETKEREIKSLVKASKELKCKDLFVLTWDYENVEGFKGKKIRFVPLWKWLLENKP